MSETRRDNTRLEVDHKDHCKQCGVKLPDVCFEKEFHPLGGDKTPELCGSCLAQEVFK